MDQTPQPRKSLRESAMTPRRRQLKLFMEI
jgi:hypothetical protein